MEFFALISKDKVFEGYFELDLFLFDCSVLSFVAGTIFIKWLDVQGVFEFKKRI